MSAVEHLRKKGNDRRRLERNLVEYEQFPKMMDVSSVKLMCHVPSSSQVFQNAVIRLNDLYGARALALQFYSELQEAKHPPPWLR